MITLGIDIGSTTSKCVLLFDGYQILGTSLVPAGIGTSGPEEAYKAVLKHSSLPERAIARTIATGYGRRL